MAYALLYTGMPSESIRKAINAPLVEVIKHALEGLEKFSRPKGAYGINYGYLLNQAIRQYALPATNIHVTLNAKALWDKLFKSSSQPIPDIRITSYHDTIYPVNDVLRIETYKGNSIKTKYFVDVYKGKAIPFNKLFIDEHTTTVADIIDALRLAYNNSPSKPLSSAKIVEILDKIHITKMLKSENAQISNSRSRINPSDILNMKSQCIFNKIVSGTPGYPTKFI